MTLPTQPSAYPTMKISRPLGLPLRLPLGAVLAASAFLAACSDPSVSVSTSQSASAAPLPTQGEAFVVETAVPANASLTASSSIDIPSGATSRDTAPPTDIFAPTGAIKQPVLDALDASSDLADAVGDEVDELIDAVADTGEEALDDIADAIVPEMDTTAPIVADPDSDLTAGSMPPPDGSGFGATPDPNNPNHTGFQPLPRAFETDQIDPLTGVPVLQRDGNDILVMAFSDISYPEYIPRDPLNEGDEEPEPHAFPQHLMNFHGRRATIDGFMIPTSFKDGKVREFILSGDPPYCCFGGFPPIDRAIDITLPEDHPGVEYSAYGVMRVIGTLSVEETFDEYGYVLGIYKLHAETVAEEF